MAEVLSQAEIDALRAAVRSGDALGDKPAAAGPAPTPAGGDEETSESQVRVTQYDFLKPRLISAVNHRLLQLAHEALAKNLQGAMFALLKMPVEIKLVAMDQVTYSEFVLSLGNPTYLAKLGTSPNMGAIAMEINPQIALAMTDLLLGGAGAAPAEARELTALEVGLLKPIIDAVLAQLKGSWASICDVGFQELEHESNPEYFRLAPPETPCLGTIFDVHMGNVSGVVNVCYPLTVIQAIFRHSESRGASAADIGGAGRNEMLRALGPVPLRVHAVLGAASLVARDLGELKPGDVVCMDKRIDTPILVAIDQSVMFSGTVGRRRGKLAVKIIGARETGSGVAAPGPKAGGKP